MAALLQTIIIARTNSAASVSTHQSWARVPVGTPSTKFSRSPPDINQGIPWWVVVGESRADMKQLAVVPGSESSANIVSGSCWGEKLWRPASAVIVSNRVGATDEIFTLQFQTSGRPSGRFTQECNVHKWWVWWVERQKYLNVYCCIFIFFSTKVSRAVQSVVITNTIHFRSTPQREIFISSLHGLHSQITMHFCIYFPRDEEPARKGNIQEEELCTGTSRPQGETKTKTNEWWRYEWATTEWVESPWVANFWFFSHNRNSFRHSESLWAITELMAQSLLLSR